jgi:hypothetical protein
LRPGFALFLFWVVLRCAQRKVRQDLPRTTRSRRRLTITASSSKMKRSGFLEVTINPGEKEPFHEHPLFSVMNIITGAPLRITPGTLQDGQIVTGKTIEVGKDNFQPPPLWMPPQGLHSAENVGTAVFRAYRIELKEGEKSSDTKPSK